MKNYKITIEVSIKDDSLIYDDWIERAILEQLEPKEFINSYDIQEVIL